MSKNKLWLAWSEGQGCVFGPFRAIDIRTIGTCGQIARLEAVYEGHDEVSASIATFDLKKLETEGILEWGGFFLISPERLSKDFDLLVEKSAKQIARRAESVRLGRAFGARQEAVAPSKNADIIDGDFTEVLD